MLYGDLPDSSHKHTIQMTLFFFSVLLLFSMCRQVG